MTTEVKQELRMVRIMMDDKNYFDLPMPQNPFSIGEFLGMWKSVGVLIMEELGCALMYKHVCWVRVMHMTVTQVSAAHENLN